MRTIVLLLSLALLTACTDPLGFVARAERDTAISQFETAAEVELARIDAQRSTEGRYTREILATLSLIGGLILALGFIWSDARVKIAQAQPPAPLIIYYLPTPPTPAHIVGTLETEEGDWYTPYRQRAITQKKTALPDVRRPL